MDFASLNRQLKFARRARNLAAFLVLLLVGSNLALALNILRETNQVVLVPSGIADGMVARGAYDRRYVEALAKDAVWAMYNVQADSLDYGRAVIGRLAAGSERADLLAQYDRVAEDIRVRKISTVFFPNRLEIASDGLSVTVLGTLSTYLDTTRTDVSEKKIIVTFAQEGASVRVGAIRIGDLRS